MRATRLEAALATTRRLLDDGNPHNARLPCRCLKLQACAGCSLPTGMVLMYYGSLQELPACWRLADGERGSPDLVGRFVLGASGAPAASSAGAAPRAVPLGTRGGSASVGLLEENLPQHNHADGTHDALVRLSKVWATGGGPDVLTAWQPELMSAKPLKDVGSGAPFSIVPPYVALYYVYRL